MKIIAALLSICFAIISAQALAHGENNSHEVAQAEVNDIDASEPDSKATDYNSSRSNKNFAAAIDIDEPSDEDVELVESAETPEQPDQDTKATDYNSSRSNKSF